MPSLFGTPEAPMQRVRTCEVARPGLRQPRVHQARDRRHHARRRMAAQPGPRAARRARRPGGRRARHVLHRRLRAGDDGRHLGRRAGAGPALGAVRGQRQGSRGPQPQPAGPGDGQGAGRGRLPGARAALREGPGGGHAGSTGSTRELGETSSRWSSPAASTPPSPSTASRRASTGCWRSSRRSCGADVRREPHERGHVCVRSSPGTPAPGGSRRCPGRRSPSRRTA